MTASPAPMTVRAAIAHAADAYDRLQRDPLAGPTAQDRAAHATLQREGAALNWAPRWRRSIADARAVLDVLVRRAA